MQFRSTAPSSRSRILVLAMLFIALAGVFAANWRLTSTSPGGNDFIPRWLGTRLLITEGLNPYDSETSLAIQEFISGRAAKPHEDQHLFAYPLYSSIIFAPFSLIENYTLVRALWMTTLELALVIMAIVGLSLANIKISPLILGGAVIFGIFWYHGMRPLVNGNPSIISALFLTLSILAIRERKDLLAGSLMALATIKPQLVVLAVVFFLLWGASHKRWRLLVGFTATLALLVIASLIIEPTWIGQNIEQIRNYPEYTLPGTPKRILANWWPQGGHILGIFISITAGAFLLWIWVRIYRSPFDSFVWGIFCTLAITNLIGIQTAVSNYVALLPAITFAFALISTKSERFRVWIFWGLAILVLVGLWLLFLVTLNGRGQSGVMFFPIPLLILTFFVVLSPKTRMNFQYYRS